MRPAIQAVIKWFEDQKLPYVLTGLRNAIRSPETLGEARPAEEAAWDSVD